LIPVSGPEMEHVDQSMLSFRVPLAQLAEIIPDNQTTGEGDDKKKICRCKVNKQFANSDEWSTLKLALDPEWRCVNPENEDLSFCMLPEYWDLWNSVTKSCNMERPQEWVRFFDGGYMEHPHMRGLYMRHGYGIQRWANGQVYAGHWRNHVYDTTKASKSIGTSSEGTLWAKIDDWQRSSENKSIPIYTGQWQEGFRHGVGTLNWEQDLKDFAGARATSSRRKNQGAGIHKCYYGEFKHGLFHGKGTLILRGAMSQSLPSHGVNPLTGQKQLKQIPPPQLAPTHLLRFEGRFKSDFEQLYKEFQKKQYDLEFMKVHMDPLEGDYCTMPDDATGLPTGEVLPSMRLEEMTKYDADIKTLKYLRYFEKDKMDIQQAGLPVPDIGLHYYRLKIDGIPADCHHMLKGAATYADGSQYDGDFVRGIPCGRGTLKQWEESAREPVAEYEGLFTEKMIDGKGQAYPVRQGEGLYTIHGQLCYNGAWTDDKRNGDGLQEILDDELSQVVGYKQYEGQWVDDKRHGSGNMTILADDGTYVYDGNFVEGKRDGYGTMTKDRADHAIYNGTWQNDNIVATDADPAWSHLEDNIYYGSLTAEGDRQGWGVLYDARGMTDPDFARCFKAETIAGRKFKTDGATDLEKYKFKLYEGNWDKNLPNGEGVQFFIANIPDGKKTRDELMTYRGQFLHGKRHGRGIWDGVDSKGKRWKYRMISGTAHNWANNEMHGIGIVEDAEHVHENVVYTHGICQMPFTKEGPPMTGFDEKSMLAGVVGRVKKGQVLATTAGEKEKLDDKQGMEVTTASVRAGIHRQSGYLENPDQVQATRPQAMGVLVRQPTDLTMPEEDVLVTGGTDGNALLNGLYFKMSGTFGVPIYKHSIMKNDKFVHRFLYRDTKKEKWLLSESPRYDTWIEMMTLENCAMVDDKNENPGRIETAWFAWHSGHHRMILYGDQDPMLKVPQGILFKQEMKDVDKIEVQSVVGFEVTGAHTSFNTSQVASLLLRHPSVYYGRPVYEAENGGQFLYWQATAGAAGHGATESEMSGPGEIAMHADATEGWWIISSEVGVRPEDGRCQACVVDNSITPDQINGHSVWRMRVPKDQKTDMLALTDATPTEPSAVLPDMKPMAPVTWNAKMHAPVADGQTVCVTIDSFQHVDKDNGEAFYIDFMDMSGNVVLRWALRLAAEVKNNKIVYNNYITGTAGEEGQWGEEETSPVPKVFSMHPLPKPLPMVHFEMKSECWDIHMTHEGAQLGEKYSFKHRSAPDSAIAPTVAVKASDNCEEIKFETILLESSDKDAWQREFVDNKLMKLKLEFWSHDTKTGLGLLDGEEKADKGMLGGLMSMGANLHGDVMGLLGGTSPRKGRENTGEGTFLTSQPLPGAASSSPP